MLCTQSMLEYATSNTSHPQDGHLHREVCTCSVPSHVQSPVSRKSPQKASVILGRTFYSLVQPQATRCEDRHSVGILQVLLGNPPSGQLVGKRLEITPRPLHSPRLIPSFMSLVWDIWAVVLVRLLKSPLSLLGLLEQCWFCHTCSEGFL